MLTATCKEARTCVLKQLSRSTLKTRVAPKSTAAFNHVSQTNEAEDAMKQANFSNEISFASPESDFSASHILMKSTYTDFDHQHKEQSEHEEVYNVNQEWSGNLSFSSPESDFTSGSHFATQSNIHQESNEEKAAKEIAEVKEQFFQNLEKSLPEKNDVAYSLSFASAESDFCNPELAELLNERQKAQLENTTSLTNLSNHTDSNQISSMVNWDQVNAPMIQKKEHQGSEEGANTVEYQELRAHGDLLSHEEPLPRNMVEATIEDDARAIVITEAEMPFRIVNVNSAWEGLCGYTKDECNGLTLSCIQGPDTNQTAVTALMSQLLRGEEAGTVLMNYRKDGSKFLNRLRVGALRDDKNTITHFVGVLKEVQEMADQFDEGSRVLA
eukprot:249809_1